MITSAERLGARVLVVDDVLANVLLLEGMLRQAGYTAVDRTQDGSAVLGLHRQNRYDLILLDLQMPGMDGFEVMDQLRSIATNAYLPVLVLTAQPGHKLRALRSGARDFITKPFDMPEVLMRVQNLLEAHLLHKALVEAGRQLATRNELLRQTFGRYLSSDIVENLLSSPEARGLGGERRCVTMLMSDLRGYTALTEGLAPERVVMMVNNYLVQMIRIIFEHRGTVDEFTGDGVFAVFGAPLSGDDDARRAVQCALSMQLGMAEVNARNRAMGLPLVEMGIGLNTGDVVVGNIGSMQRTKYAVVGGAVNVTSRIESCTTGGEIMISQATLDAVGGDLEFVRRQAVSAKGISRPIVVYSVSGLRGRPDLALPVITERLDPPSEPLGVRFVELDGKDTSGSPTVGELMALSRDGAEIASAAVVEPFANLKLRLVKDGVDVEGDLYAKVSESDAVRGVFRVRFTAVPVAVEALLATLAPAPKT